MKLFAVYINVNKSVDIQPGEQAVVMRADSKEQAIAMAKRLFPSEWRVRAQVISYAYCETRNLGVEATGPVYEQSCTADGKVVIKRLPHRKAA
jgi:hypothetical protein